MHFFVEKKTNNNNRRIFSQFFHDNDKENVDKYLTVM